MRTEVLRKAVRLLPTRIRAELGIDARRGELGLARHAGAHLVARMQPLLLTPETLIAGAAVDCVGFMGRGTNRPEGSLMMPIILWLMGVPLVVVVLLMLARDLAF
jgi:hypothetical protein